MFAVKRIAVAIVVATLLAATGVVFATSGAQSGFSASVRNSNNFLGSGSSLLTATQSGTVQCSSVSSSLPSTSSFPCSGNPIGTTLAATGNTTTATALKQTGTVPFTSATYQANSCGVVQLSNSRSATDPMIPRGPVTYNNAGPTSIANSGSVGFNGSSTMAVDITQNTTPPQDFSIGIWFQSTIAQGALMGYATSPSDVSPEQYDRHMYFNAAGQIVFGVYNNGAQTIASPNSYNDGSWHYAVATANSNVTSTTSVIQLFIDGALVNSLTLNSASVAQSSQGWWRIGQSRTTTADYWNGNGQYFSGRLSNASVANIPYTAAQVKNIYQSTNQAMFNSRINSKSPVALWTLGDDGLSTYGGSLPVIGTASPCSHVRVSVGTVGKCAYPAQATACPALSSTYALYTLVGAGALALAPSAVSATQTLTVTTARDTDYDTSYDVGLNILIPTTITEVGFLSNSFNWATDVVII